MKVYVLGCGDAFGSGGRNQSGYLVEADQRFFLLDCGPTTLRAMKRAGLDPKRLDAILPSHLHSDHFGGISFFFLEYLYKRPRDKPLHISDPTGSYDKTRYVFRIMYVRGSVSKHLPPSQFH